MAIYHLNLGHISRSTGRSSAQSAAYITGEKLHETRRDLEANYKNRESDIVFSETFAPNGVPPEFKDINVWDKFETFEDEYAVSRFPKDLIAREKYENSARTAFTVVVALPRELSLTSSRDLVSEFANSRFVSRGLIVTCAIHDDEGNPHAHLQISRRSVNEKGEISWAKDRSIVERKELIMTRKLWADLTNTYLEREGSLERITEKSFLDLGIHLEPTQHRGWYADRLYEQGQDSRIHTENEDIFLKNRESLQEDPSIVLNEITSKNATFTQIQLLSNIRRRIGSDENILSQVFESALNQAIPIGEGIDGITRYTSESYKQMEKSTLSLISEMMAVEINENHSSSTIMDPEKVSLFSKNCSSEQRTAIHNLTQSHALSVMVGRAGSGKTTTLKAVADIYKHSGYKVIGTSLSALASENLGTEAGIESATLHSWIYKWNMYKDATDKFLSFNSIIDEGLLKQLEWYQNLDKYKSSQMDSKTILIIDEAGMVGTKQWGELLIHAKNAGARIIAVGDDHQFKAIDAGDIFRELKIKAEENNKLSTLQTIHRQKQTWMKEASTHFSQLDVQSGLALYENHGHLHSTDNLESDIAQAYMERIHQSSPIDVLVLAFTNEQTQRLNDSIREHLKKDNLIQQQDILTLNNRNFSIGDKIVFLQNDKFHIEIRNPDSNNRSHDFIQNGTTGILESVSEKGDITIRLSNQSTAHFNKANYTNIDHGYALTTHKSQGQTVNHTIIEASQYMDAKGFYVAMTRHREDVSVFYSNQNFKNFKDMSFKLSRFDHKDLVKDYTIRPENQDPWNRVQEYKLSIMDASSALKNQDIDDYKAIKQDQLILGKEILSNFETHKLYLNQAGLTHEMLEISTGLKPRPLSLIEQKAKLTVELYGESSQLTRTLWKEIKDSGSRAKNHPNYKLFQEARSDRDSLASIILENIPLHRNFVREMGCEYRISLKTMKAQVDYREAQKAKALSVSPIQNIKQQKDDQAFVPYADSKSHHHTPFHSNKTQRPEFEKTSSEITHELNRNIKDLALQFLGDPTSKNTREWRYGRKGSIAIQVAGIRQGIYSNFETGESGNAISLISEHMNLNRKEAFKWGAEWLGFDSRSQSLSTKHFEKKEETLSSLKTWTVLKPKTNTQVPDLKTDPHLAYMMKGKHETARFTYKDEKGETLGYVIRLEDNKGNKITPALTYGRDDKGIESWKWKGFGNQGSGVSGDRALYGLDILAKRKESPILIVEGEKTCEAARVLFPDHVVLTWSGGSGSTHKTDWTPLKDKQNITLWPDHDMAGMKAAHKIETILTKQGNTSISMVDLPSTLPHKWDLADKIPEGWNLDQIKDLVFMAAPVRSIDDLKRMEKDIGNTHPNDLQSERDESILNYLNFSLNLPHNAHLKAEHGINLVSYANNQSPTKALAMWKDISGDKTFESMTREEAHFKQEHARTLMIETKPHVNDMVIQTLEKYVSVHPDAVIEKCRSLSDKFEKIENTFNYLLEDIDTKRHTWLNYKDADYLLKLGAKDPINALTKWQEVSGDKSFIPLTNKDLLSKQHEAKVLLEEAKTYVKENSYTTLKEDLVFHPDKVIQQCQSILEPIKVQHILEDQKQRERLESIINYLTSEITCERHSWLNSKDVDGFTQLIQKDPQDALRKWQSIIDDKTFKPMTRDELQIKSTEAQDLFQKAQSVLKPHDLRHIENTNPHNPQLVIDACHKLITSQYEHQKDADVSKFLIISKRYSEKQPNERSSMGNTLSDMVVKYEKDDQFMKSIQRNDIARSVSEELAKMRQMKMNQKEMDRGFER